MSNRLTYFPIKMFSSKRGYRGHIGGLGGVSEKSLREGWTVGQVGRLSPAQSHLRRLATVRLRDLLAVGYGY